MRWTLGIVGCGVLVGAAAYLGLAGSSSGEPASGTARMVYLHVPVAANALAAFTVAAAAGLMYLWRKNETADRLARAAAGVALVLATVMLATGMIWARMAWGHWWDFKSPRLMLSLVLWILLIAYFLLRSSLPEGRRRMKVAAAYALIAYLDVPLVFLATRLVSTDIHPAAVSSLNERPAGMALALTAAFAAATAVHGLLLAANLRRIRRADERRAAAHDCS